MNFRAFSGLNAHGYTLICIYRYAYFLVSLYLISPKAGSRFTAWPVAHIKPFLERLYTIWDALKLVLRKVPWSIRWTGFITRLVIGCVVWRANSTLLGEGENQVDGSYSQLGQIVAHFLSFLFYFWQQP